MKSRLEETIIGTFRHLPLYHTCSKLSTFFAGAYHIGDKQRPPPFRQVITTPPTYCVLASRSPIYRGILAGEQMGGLIMGRPRCRNQTDYERKGPFWPTGCPQRDTLTFRRLAQVHYGQPLASFSPLLRSPLPCFTYLYVPNVIRSPLEPYQSNSTPSPIARTQHRSQATTGGQWATRTTRPLLRSSVVKAKSHPGDQDGYGFLRHINGTSQLTA